MTSQNYTKKHLHGETQILIAVDSFSKWPTVKICKPSETIDVNFLASNFTPYGIPKKIKSDKGGAFISKEYQGLCKNRNFDIEFCTPRMHTGNGAVERAMQTLENLIIANLEDGRGLTESVNRVLRAMRYTIHTGLKVTLFELHHGRKPRTELAIVVKDGKTYISNLVRNACFSTEQTQNTLLCRPRCGGGYRHPYRNGEDKIRGKTPHRGHLTLETKNSVRYTFKFVEKSYNKKSLKGRIQNKRQTAISGTERTIETTL